jgi:regulatory protein YycI of two-component signal transduction system YycFG
MQVYMIVPAYLGSQGTKLNAARGEDYMKIKITHPILSQKDIIPLMFGYYLLLKNLVVNIFIMVWIYTLEHPHDKQVFI